MNNLFSFDGVFIGLFLYFLIAGFSIVGTLLILSENIIVGLILILFSIYVFYMIIRELSK